MKGEATATDGPGPASPAQRRRAASGFCGLCAFGLLGFVAWISLSLGAHKLRTPPKSMATIEYFRRTLDKTQSHSYRTFKWRDREYFEARRLTPLWTLHSGSTCYVFDDSGRFLDWIWDNGESNTWDVNWGQTGRTPIEWAEIERRLLTKAAPE